MFKRTFWFTTGVATGAGGMVWANRRMKATLARYAPDRLGVDAAARVRQVGGDVRAAIAEGRTAMREREAELRAGR